MPDRSVETESEATLGEVLREGKHQRGCLGLHDCSVAFGSLTPYVTVREALSL